MDEPRIASRESPAEPPSSEHPADRQMVATPSANPPTDTEWSNRKSAAVWEEFKAETRRIKERMREWRIRKLEFEALARRSQTAEKEGPNQDPSRRRNEMMTDVYEIDFGSEPTPEWEPLPAVAHMLQSCRKDDLLPLGADNQYDFRSAIQEDRDIQAVSKFMAMLILSQDEDILEAAMTMINHIPQMSLQEAPDTPNKRAASVYKGRHQAAAGQTTRRILGAIMPPINNEADQRVPETTTKGGKQKSTAGPMAHEVFNEFVDLTNSDLAMEYPSEERSKVKARLLLSLVEYEQIKTSGGQA